MERKILVGTVSREFGEVTLFEEQCPGVYYMTCLNEDMTSTELLVVERSCPHISAAVKAYGAPLGDALLVYDYSDLYGGKQLVMYEALRYRVQNGLPFPDDETLFGIAVYAADVYPDYFGAIPVPVFTPSGFTVRYIKLANGIYALETDRGVRMIAIAGVIWTLELRDATVALGETAVYAELPEELTHLFFTERDGCLALFELLHACPALRRCQRLDRRALMNAIWTWHPDYALSHNLREQQGLNDLLGLALNGAEIETPLHGSAENMVALSAETGTEYIKW